MDLSNFILTVFCLIDDQLKYLGRLRERSPAPTLCDSEVGFANRIDTIFSQLTERYCVKKVWARDL
jgi:hypothetical protein